MPKDDKTNVMRLLDQRRIPYTPRTYPHQEGVAVDGLTVAQALGLDPETVFKTLLARGASGGIYVFVIPVGDTLDLRKAAKAVREKSVEMVHVKEILVGMRKPYPTVFHETAGIVDAITVSAGKIGYQVTLSPAELMALVEGTEADIVV